MYKFTFSSSACLLFQERVSVDESEISNFSPLLFILTEAERVSEGHKSQTRLIFKNTYGDAFNVRTVRMMEGEVSELLITSNVGLGIDGD